MEGFIYDYYGYNIEEIKDGSFTFLDYRFLLIATTETEQSMEKLNGLINSLYNVFDQDIVYIVRNKYNKYISTSKDDNNICLLTYKISNEVGLSEFVKMNQTYLNNFSYRVDLQEIIILWDQRLEFIQNQCLVNLNFDNEAHLALYKYTILAIGLALNSLQYLSDIHIDFQGRKYPSTLTHRRIKKIDKFNLFNPFNLIIDHSSRDLAELYKNDLIDLYTLIDIANKYYYSIDEYEYILARILYPTAIFDVLEDIANDAITQNHNKDIYEAIKSSNRQLEKIKEYYDYLKSNMNIRPIQWVNKTK